MVTGRIWLLLFYDLCRRRCFLIQYKCLLHFVYLSTSSSLSSISRAIDLRRKVRRHFFRDYWFPCHRTSNSIGKHSSRRHQRRRGGKNWVYFFLCPHFARFMFRLFDDNRLSSVRFFPRHNYSSCVDSPASNAPTLSMRATQKLLHRSFNCGDDRQMIFVSRRHQNESPFALSHSQLWKSNESERETGKNVRKNFVIRCVAKRRTTQFSFQFLVQFLVRRWTRKTTLAPLQSQIHIKKSIESLFLKRKKTHIAVRRVVVEKAWFSSFVRRAQDWSNWFSVLNFSLILFSFLQLIFCQIRRKQHRKRSKKSYEFRWVKRKLCEKRKVWITKAVAKQTPTICWSD